MNNVPGPPRRWRPQFSLQAVLLVTFLAAVLMAAASALLRAVRSSDAAAGGTAAVFVLALVAAPVGLAILLSLLVLVRDKLATRQRPSQHDPDDSAGTHADPHAPCGSDSHRPDDTRGRR